METRQTDRHHSSVSDAPLCLVAFILRPPAALTVVESVLMRPLACEQGLISSVETLPSYVVAAAARGPSLWHDASRRSPSGLREACWALRRPISGVTEQKCKSSASTTERRLFSPIGVISVASDYNQMRVSLVFFFCFDKCWVTPISSNSRRASDKRRWCIAKERRLQRHQSKQKVWSVLRGLHSYHTPDALEMFFNEFSSDRSLLMPRLLVLSSLFADAGASFQCFQANCRNFFSLLFFYIFPLVSRIKRPSICLSVCLFQPSVCWAQCVK